MGIINHVLNKSGPLEIYSSHPPLHIISLRNLHNEQVPNAFSSLAPLTYF